MTGRTAICLGGPSRSSEFRISLSVNGFQSSLGQPPRGAYLAVRFEWICFDLDRRRSPLLESTAVRLSRLTFRVGLHPAAIDLFGTRLPPMTIIANAP